MRIDEFVERHPVVYHTAADGAWPSIRARGLLSTAALLDVYEPPTPIREEILRGVRRKSFVLKRAGLPPVTVRDQLPLKFLHRCLLPGTSEQQFLDELNRRVFFWLSNERLMRLLNARAYRNSPQTVFHVDTASLLESHPEAELAPYNTGSVHVPTAPARGVETFLPIESYPYSEWARKRGASGEAAVELTIPYAVPSFRHHVLRIERWESGVRTEALGGPE